MLLLSPPFRQMSNSEYRAPPNDRARYDMQKELLGTNVTVKLLHADDIILYLDHFDVSVSSIIKEFDNFSSLSGYKINWSKSALMPINNVKVNSSIPSFIPIKEYFIYLGIYKNIHKIARDNFNNILVKVKTDIQRWKNLKVSLQGRISTVKMNLLPRFNFFFSYATTFSPSRLL